MSSYYTRRNYRTPATSMGIQPRKVYPYLEEPKFKLARKHLQKLQMLQPPIRFELPDGGWGERGDDNSLRSDQIIQLAYLIAEHGIDVKEYVGNQAISSKRASELINNLRKISKPK